MSSSQHQQEQSPKSGGGGGGGRLALTTEPVAAETRSEQHAHGQGVVPKGSLAARMRSAKDRYDNAQEARKEEAEAGPMGRGAVGGKGVPMRPGDEDVCAPPPPGDK